ncbi:MAG: complex I subunit 1 family protein [Candidatus Micrarchaeaceae archaeon]
MLIVNVFSLAIISWLSSLINSSNILHEVLGFVIYAIGIGILIIVFDYFMGWLERKIIAKVQLRHGPTFVGKYGLLQNLADFTKLLAKAHFMPKNADKLLFSLALPLMLAISIFLIFLLPIVPQTGIGNFANSLLIIFALLAFMPLLIFIAGTASGNKFGQISAQRSVAMLLSYEIPMLLVIASVGMLAKSYNLFSIVSAQTKYWYVLLMPIGFFVLFVAMLAEMERSPFDLREADSELIAGWLTDVSAPYYTLALFLDYTKVFLGSAVIALLFFGGWQGPFLPPIAWLLIKAVVIAVFVMLIRATAVRMRLDRLLKLGWFILLPLALINLFITYMLFVG